VDKVENAEKDRLLCIESIGREADDRLSIVIDRSIKSPCIDLLPIE
jgi:hypothetical protein